MGKVKSIGILTSGGDCPGLNAAIRGVVKSAFGMGVEKVYGFSNGYKGLIDADYKLLKPKEVSGILTLGGTILGTSREKPFKINKAEGTDAETGSNKASKIIENYKKLNLNCLVTLGGNGTHKTANLLSKEGLNVIGLPKTIDNDIFGTDITFGFQSAVDIATEAIDRIHSTALSHNRIMVVEVMGHKAGWLALHSGIAAGGDVILLPEIPYDINIVSDHILKRANEGKRFSIVVVAEGALSTEEAAMDKDTYKKHLKNRPFTTKGYEVAKLLEEQTGMEARVTVLGYTQRGGTPSPFDRVLATTLGASAANLIAKEEFGVMVAIDGGKVVSRKLSDIAGKLKLVPPDSFAVKTARLTGSCFGN